MKPITTPCLDRWIAALKSGTYKKCTRSYSYAENGTVSYCGLGVLMESGIVELGDYGGFPEDTRYVAYALREAGIDPNKPVTHQAKWASYSSRAGYLVERVVIWNDDQRRSLPAIGRKIEALVEKWRQEDAR
jgi:hypothetical protein